MSPWVTSKTLYPIYLTVPDRAASVAVVLINIIRLKQSRFSSENAPTYIDNCASIEQQYIIACEQDRQVVVISVANTEPYLNISPSKAKKATEMRACSAQFI